MNIFAAIHNCFGILQIMKHHTKNTTHHQNSASITKFCQQDFVLKSVVIEGKKGISGRICFSKVLRNFIRYFQAPSKFLEFDSEKSFSQNQSVFSAIFLKVPSSFSDLFCHGFRALWARRLSFQYSLGLQIFLGCIFIPNQGMQRDKIHL